MDLTRRESPPTAALDPEGDVSKIEISQCGDPKVNCEEAPRCATRQRIGADGCTTASPTIFSLVIGKAVLGAIAAGVPPREIVRDALLYGATHRESWGAGLTTLMALADILPVLVEDDRYLALFHGIAAVAEDCEGQPPRTNTEPLGGEVSFATLARWLPPLGPRAPPHRCKF